MHTFDSLTVIRDKVRRTLHETGLDPDTSALPLLALLGIQGSAAPAPKRALCPHLPGPGIGVPTASQPMPRAAPYSRGGGLAGGVTRNLRRFVPCWLTPCLKHPSSCWAPIALAHHRRGSDRPRLPTSSSARRACRQLDSTPRRAQHYAFVAYLTGHDPHQSGWESLLRSRVDPSGARSNVQEPLEVPATIQDVLLARIDHLPEAAKRLLHMAAVLGPQGPIRLLHAIWDAPDTWDEALQSLQQRALFTVQTELEEPHYAFAHTLTQEVAYASLLPLRRHVLHTQAGQALETLYAARLATVCELLAAHYIQALDSLASWPTADRELRHLELTLRLAQAWSFLGRFPESRTLLEQHLLAMERLHRPDLTGRYYFRLGRTYSLLGDHTRARTATKQALVAAGQAGDRETQGLVYYELAREQFLTGPPRASLAYGQKAVRLLAQTGAQWWLGMAHWVVGVAQALLGAFAPALEAMVRAEAIGQSLQDPHIQSYAAFTMGWVEAIRGHTAVGLTACHHARQLAIDPVNLAHAIGALGTAYLEHGDVDQALLWLRQAAEAWQAYRMPSMQAWLTALWADALCIQGDSRAGCRTRHPGSHPRRRGRISICPRARAPCPGPHCLGAGYAHRSCDASEAGPGALYRH